MTLHELPQRRAPESTKRVPVPGEPEVGAVLAHMWENGEKLARQEIALGLAELQLRADKLKKGLLAGVIFGAVYNAGILLLLAALVLGLSEVMAPWLAALIVGVLTLGTAYAMQKRAAQQAEQAAALIRATDEAFKEGFR